MKLRIAELTFALIVRTAMGQDFPSSTPSSAPSASKMYFDVPEQKWTVQLPSTGSPAGPRVGKGNAVSVSPDGASLYITLDNGRLEVLSASDGTHRWGYEPTPFAPGWTTSCSSAISFGEKDSQGFAIHTVIHTPPAFFLQDVQSQLVAVSHPAQEVLWTAMVPGEIQGNPIVTSGERFNGEYIMFTHNQNVTSAEPVGGFSMVVAETGDLIFTEIAGDSVNDPDPANLVRVDTLRLPYGPLGTAPSPDFGRYPDGEGNAQDLFVWATNINMGWGPNGYTRAFQLPRLFTPAFVEILSTSFLKENRWNSIAGPTISSDGLDLLFGVRSNSVRGWTGALDFTQNANVARTLDVDTAEPRMAIPYSPVFSGSEESFFVSTTVGTLYSLTTARGETVWSADFGSPVSAKVKASPDGAFVYYTTESGTVAALDQESGEEAWSITCDDIVEEPGTACADVIEAEASLAASELVLYYSDALGNVKALNLGEGVFNTTAPTPFPTTSPAPTAEPTSPFPTTQPTVRVTLVPSEYPSDVPSLEPTELPTTSPGPTVEGASQAPSGQPTPKPSDAPTMAPTVSSSEAPTSSPTVAPTPAPTPTPVETPAPIATPEPTPAPVEEEPTLAPGEIDGCSNYGLSVVMALLTGVVAFLV